MAEKVKVIGYVGNKTRIYIPELRVNRLFEKYGQSFLFDRDTVEEMFYYPSIESAFKEGLFYIDDKDLRIKLGLEEENGELGDEVIAPISDTTILTYLKAKSYEDFEAYVTELPKVHQDRFINVAVDNKVLDYNKLNLLKKLTGKDVVKIIQLNEE